jgi:hypothetical protein
MQLKKVNAYCPYCHAKIYFHQKNSLEVIYECNTFGSRVTGLYYKRCK